MEEVRRVDTPSASDVARMRRLFERNPTSTLFARLADAYLVRNDETAAIAVCRRGLKYRPSYITGHLVLGRALLRVDDRAGAEEEFRKVLQLEPDNPAALQYLAEIARRGGDEERADSLLDRLWVLNPFSSAFAVAETASLTSEDTEAATPEPEEDTVPESQHSEEADAEAATEGGDLEASDDTDRLPFVSLTLARLYARQGHRGQAERVLKLVNPEGADDLLDQLERDNEN